MHYQAQLIKHIFASLPLEEPLWMSAKHKA